MIVLQNSLRNNMWQSQNPDRISPVSMEDLLTWQIISWCLKPLLVPRTLQMKVNTLVALVPLTVVRKLHRTMLSCLCEQRSYICLHSGSESSDCNTVRTWGLLLLPIAIYTSKFTPSVSHGSKQMQEIIIIGANSVSNSMFRVIWACDNYYRPSTCSYRKRWWEPLPFSSAIFDSVTGFLWWYGAE